MSTRGGGSGKPAERPAATSSRGSACAKMADTRALKLHPATSSRDSASVKAAVPHAPNMPLNGDAALCTPTSSPKKGSARSRASYSSPKDKSQETIIQISSQDSVVHVSSSDGAESSTDV